MTKEETIDSAYGNYADISKGLRDENGWIPIGCYYTYFPQNSERSECGWFERPKFLQGIENNNGWIKIESEEDLPTTEIDCHIIYNNNLMTFSVWDNVLKGFYIGIVKQNPTHYQPIIKPQPPLY